jgi:hypothetical protein
MAADPIVPSAVNVFLAKIIAMVVRNAMEDFHCKHLTDEQMKELNPLVRNAIFTALHATSRMGDSPADHAFVEMHARAIPRYWEEPQLLQPYVDGQKTGFKRSTASE